MRGSGRFPLALRSRASFALEVSLRIALCDDRFYPLAPALANPRIGIIGSLPGKLQTLLHCERHGIARKACEEISLTRIDNRDDCEYASRCNEIGFRFR